MRLLNYIVICILILSNLINDIQAQSLSTGVYTLVNADKGVQKTIEGSEDIQYLNPTPSITIKDYKKVKIQKNKQIYQQALLLTFTKEGQAKLAKVTADNLKKPLGFVIDNKLIFCPVVQEAITGGKVQITLGYTDRKKIKTTYKLLKREIKNKTL